MKVLLLGYSRIARRRVLPALAALGIQELDVASVSAEATVIDGFSGRWYRSYEEALSTSDATVAYISTTNVSHAELVRQALRRGFHVVVDKPATLGRQEAEEAVALARASGLCLAEATVWGYHPQVLEAANAFAGGATRLVATFSFPPMPAGDHRYQAALGGGAENDIGQYAMTPGRLFFGQPSHEVVARVQSRTGDVVSSFSLLVQYPGGRSMTGLFGFDTAYCNQLRILGPDSSAVLERVFSPPPDAALRVLLQDKTGTRELPVPPGDSFAIFLNTVFAAIGEQDFEPFYRTLLFDAKELDKLRTALQAV